jgi:hypothetical protein
MVARIAIIGIGIALRPDGRAATLGGGGNIGSRQVGGKSRGERTSAFLMLATLLPESRLSRASGFPHDLANCSIPLVGVKHFASGAYGRSGAPDRK